MELKLEDEDGAHLEKDKQGTTEWASLTYIYRRAVHVSLKAIDCHS